METFIGRIKFFLYSYFPEENVEAGLEVLRWTFLFIVSWFISEMVRQIDLVPQYHNIRFLWFTFSIPVQGIFAFTLAVIGRYIDKKRYTQNKIYHNVKKGTLPF